MLKVDAILNWFMQHIRKSCCKEKSCCKNKKNLLQNKTSCCKNKRLLQINRSCCKNKIKYYAHAWWLGVSGPNHDLRKAMFFPFRFWKSSALLAGKTVHLNNGTYNRIYTYHLHASRSLVHRKHKPFSSVAVTFFLVLPPGQYLW